VKLVKNGQSLPIKYEDINVNECVTKLYNLVLFYPYNSYQAQNLLSMDPFNFPFSGIISECHRKGYPLFLDWFENYKEYHHRSDIPIVRKEINDHLLNLFERIDYTKKKNHIEFNNFFKELNCWIGEMYKNISYQDDYGGWENAGLREIEEKEEFFRKNPGKGWRSGDVAVSFRKVFNFNNFILNENSVKYILTSQEFDDFLNEIFRLMGKNWISCDAGKLRIIGNSVEEFQERRVYKELEKYPKVTENVDKAYEHKLTGEWNDVLLYCCKTLENFYKNLLGDKEENSKLSLEKLIQKVRQKSKKIFRGTDSNVMNGIDKLLLSGINIVGTVRNTRDSGHGNEKDVLEWEAKMGYNYTILLLRTILIIKK